MAGERSDAAPEHLQLRLGHAPDRVTALGRQVHAFLLAHGIDERRSHRCEVALEEVLTNLVRHAARAGRAPDAEIDVAVRGGDVAVQVTDDGPPFDPTTAPPFDEHKPLLERSGGGMGIHLLRQLTRGLRHERAGDRNHLRFEL